MAVVKEARMGWEAVVVQQVALPAAVAVAV